MHTHAPPGEGGRVAQRPRFEVADIVRASGDAFRATHALTPAHNAVLRDIVRCRTAVLGGFADVCPECGYTEVAYNSCRNRHCPKCQAIAQHRWLEQRCERMLPVHAFHVVFTLPDKLRPLVQVNRRALFNLLFAAAADALKQLGRDPKYIGGDIGITAVLHTWTRDLQFHPHIHCIVTGGGLAPDGSSGFRDQANVSLPRVRPGRSLPWKVARAPRQALRAWRPSPRRRGGPLRRPTRLRPTRDRPLPDPLGRPPQAPLRRPGGVLCYVGRYTHRVGISNARIVALDDKRVTSGRAGMATCTLTHEKFLQRFLLHVLPDRFTNIRHYGLFAPGKATEKLELARTRLAEAGVVSPLPLAKSPADFREVLLALTGVDIKHCPRCGVGAPVRRPLDPRTTSPIAPHSRAPPTTS